MSATVPTAALRVLLVEDDPGDVFLVRELLAEVDPTVQLTVAESLTEALDRGLLAGCDCVLLDLNLPGTSGPGRAARGARASTRPPRSACSPGSTTSTSAWPRSPPARRTTWSRARSTARC